MKKAIVNLWKYMTEHWSEEELTWHLKSHGLDPEQLTSKYISKLSSEKADDIIFNLTCVLQDVSGTDSYNKLFGMIKEATKLTDSQIDKAMGF